MERGRWLKREMERSFSRDTAAMERAAMGRAPIERDITAIQVSEVVLTTATAVRPRRATAIKAIRAMAIKAIRAMAIKAIRAMAIRDMATLPLLLQPLLRGGLDRLQPQLLLLLLLQQVWK